MGWGGGAHYCPLALPSRKGERDETADITHTTVQQKHKTKLYTHSAQAQNGKYPYFSASLDRALNLLAQNNFFNILSQC